MINKSAATDSDAKSGEQRLEELRQTRIASVEHQALGGGNEVVDGYSWWCKDEQVPTVLDFRKSLGF